MNEVLKTIMERKSVRNYAADKVSPEDLKAIAEAAIQAPNAMNNQIWHFSVVSDPAMLERMNEACRKGMASVPIPMFNERAKDPDFKAFFGAPAVIVVTVAEDKFGMFNGGTAAQNICLAAKALGYGSCVTASTGFMFDGDDKLAADLGVPEGYQFAVAIPIGVEADGPDDHVRDRDKSVISYF